MRASENFVRTMSFVHAGGATDGLPVQLEGPVVSLCHHHMWPHPLPAAAKSAVTFGDGGVNAVEGEGLQPSCNSAQPP